MAEDNNTKSGKSLSCLRGKVIESSEVFGNQQIPSNSQISLSNSKPINEIEFYRNLSIAEDMSDFMRRVLAVINRLGFSDFTFARLTSQNGFEIKLNTTPKELMKTYVGDAYSKYDMMLEYAYSNNSPIFQTSISDYVDSAPFITEKIKKNRELKKIYSKYGYEDYFAIPMSAHNGNGRVLFAVLSEDVSRLDFQRRTNQCRPILFLLGEAIDYIGSTKFSEFFLSNEESRDLVITPRPLMLLSTLAKYDLTLQQAADKLQISIDTANKHMAAAKQALGANTQAAAVYRAIKEGLISIGNDDFNS